MTNSLSIHSTSYEQPARSKRLVWFLLLWGLGTLVAGAGYFAAPAAVPRPFYKTTLPVALLVLTWLLGRREGLRPYQNIFRALFAVSLGIWLAWLLAQMWDFSGAGAWETAVLKLIEVFPIVAAILVVNRLAGHNLAWLYVRKGQIWRSLGLGLLVGALLALLFFTTGGFQLVAAGGMAYLAAWLPAIIVFSVANAFMEELWFRGLWLREFGVFLGGRAALWLTTLIFVTLHVVVNMPQMAAPLLLQLTVAWFFLAFSCGFITQKTGSLWGAVLAHTIVDILFLLAVFAA